MTTPLQAVLSKLETVKKRGKEYICRCPAHEDKTPSLNVSLGADDKVILHCHAGCTVDAILEKIGLTAKDLFSHNGIKTEPITYDYVDSRDRLLYQVIRKPGKKFNHRRPDGNGDWVYNLNGVERVPYRLPEVIQAVMSGETIYIVEGEKDADRLAALGLTATTNSGGAGKWAATLSAYLQGATVVVLPDNDEPGRDHARAVADSVAGIASVKIIELPGLPEKGDVSDYLVEHSKTDLIKIVEKTPEWEPGVSVNPLGMHPLTTLGKPLILCPQTGITHLIEPLIVSEHINTLYGDGGQCKSLIALAAGASIASGANFIDQATTAAKVLYVDFELTGGVQAVRLAHICEGLSINPESLTESLYYCSPGVDEAIPSKLRELIPLLIEEKKSRDYALIIIDSIGAALEGDPESASDICALLQALRPLGTVLLLDHQSKKQRGEKSGDKTPFGSVYKTNLSRNVWHLNSTSSGNKRLCQLTHKKSNFAAIHEPLTFDLTFSENSITFAVCEPSAEMIEHLTIKQKIILALRELKKATSPMIAENIDEALTSVKPIISTLTKSGEIEPTGEKDGQAPFYRLPGVEERVNQPACNGGADTPIEQDRQRVVNKSLLTNTTHNSCEDDDDLTGFAEVEL